MIVADEVLSISEIESSRQGNTGWSEVLQTSSKALGAVWRGLRNLWLLLASCSAVLALVLSSYYLRQLPGQLMDDPLAAARWLMSTSAEYGMAGDFLRGLGLFNLPHSPLLHLLLALLGLILFVQLGDLLGAAWRYQQLANLLASKVATAGEPVPLPPLQPIYRWRLAQATPPAETSQRLQAHLAATFKQIHLITVKTPTDPATTPADAPPEIRLLATRQQRWILVRPVGLIGLLLLWYVIWLILTTGWSVTPPALAPGAEYRDAPHELVLRYQVGEPTKTTLPHLEARLGALTQSGTATSKANMRLGQVEVATTPGAPGLLISTMSGDALLRRPGQPKTIPAVGLVFPNPGSEESLVLTQTIVLRIVRIADEQGHTNKDVNAGLFAVEVYQGSDKQPVQRIQIREATIAPFSIHGQTVALQFMPLPSLNVEVHYLPGTWLSWLALALIVVGAVGFWFHPAFVLVQVAPWPENRSVVVVQSDRPREAEALRQWASRLVGQ